MVTHHHLGSGFLIYQAIRSAAERVEIISDRMFCITVRGRWHDIFLNVHAPRMKVMIIKDLFCYELKRVLDQIPKHNIKILLGDFNVRGGSENKFKPTITNESLHEINILSV
jgi:hypothetical protein